jgi:ribosomal protein L17
VKGAGKSVNDAAARIEGACIQLHLEERESARELTHRRAVEATARRARTLRRQLDKLLRVAGEANSDPAALDQQEPEEIAAHRDNALR